MVPRDLGENRLRSGFHRSTVQPRAGTSSDSDDGEPPIDIHDLETEDDEVDGGITLNLQGHGDDARPIVISDDDDAAGTDAGSIVESELEEGEERENVSESQDKQMRDVTQQRTSSPDASFVVDPTPSKIQQVYLRDLSPAQLEVQIKYAFWQFRRDEIDLSRLARCLHCQEDGHLDENCPGRTCAHCNAYAEHDSVLCPIVKRCQRCREPGHLICQDMKNTTIPCDVCTLHGHTEDDCPVKHYNRQAMPSAESLHLWISCCACASKSHLVGDCPDASSATGSRWSLRSLDPNKVINLNLQTGIEKREREAENRDLRPEGMRIRGRATRHNADANRQDPSDSDDLENFFSHPPPRRDDRRHPPPTRGPRFDQFRPGVEPRYDRYDAPSDVYRPPRNNYYATDSFGRQRSRSPPRYSQRSHVWSRSSSPSSRDPYRRFDDPNTGRRSSPPSRNHSNKRHKQQEPPQNMPSRGFSIQLPTRKGSNPNLQNGSSAGLPPKPTAATQPGQPKTSNQRNPSRSRPPSQSRSVRTGEDSGKELQQKKKNKKKNRKNKAGGPS